METTELDLAEAAMIVRLIRERKKHLVAVGGPCPEGYFTKPGEWLDEKYKNEHDTLDALDEKITRAILG